MDENSFVMTFSDRFIRYSADQYRQGLDLEGWAEWAVYMNIKRTQSYRNTYGVGMRIENEFKLYH
jgi:beta-glucosidase/6-phospho-beta-glucosidase/beta-galactosidase